MQSDPLRVMVIGQSGSPGLEGSHGRALASIGCQVGYFDIEGAVRKHIKLSRLGRTFNSYVPVEPWLRKANRQLFAAAYERRTDLIVVTGGLAVRAGTLAQIKVSRPDTRLALIWPDTLVNLERHTIECLPIFDLVATYSQRNVQALESFGARRTMWLPFAVDFELHPSEVVVSRAERERFRCDVIFIGNYNPEREQAILALLDAGIRVKVYGTDRWQRDATQRVRVGQYFQKEILVGEAFVKASRSAELCLNAIDPTNYPAANMRFFENFGTGTTSINSACPELEDVFREGEATAYFSSPRELVQVTQRLLRDPGLCTRLAARAKELITEGHTYVHRVRALLDALELDPSGTEG